MKRATLIMAALALFLACGKDVKADLITNVSWSRQAEAADASVENQGDSFLYYGNAVPSSVTLQPTYVFPSNPNSASMTAGYQFNSAYNAASFDIVTTYSVANAGLAYEHGSDGNTVPITFTTTQALRYALVVSSSDVSFMGNLNNHPVIDVFAGLSQDPNFAYNDNYFSLIHLQAGGVSAIESGSLAANTTYYFSTQQSFSLYETTGGFYGSPSLSGADEVYLLLYPDSSAPGSSQLSPVLPNSINSTNSYFFTNAQSGLWYDPPLASGFDYEAAPGTLFTKIDAFPTGFNQSFTVSVNGQAIGTYGAGQSVIFPNDGVSEFSITGIDPQVDTTQVNAFPLQLEFNNSSASFTMTPLNSPSVATPEPSTFTLLGIGAVCSIAYGYRQRRRKV